MKRVMLPGLAYVAAGSASVALSAYQQPAGGQPAPTRRRGREAARTTCSCSRAAAATRAVFVTADGVMVVDTKNPGWGQPILDKIKELTDKPITTIINTHTHGDHVSGNVEFPADGRRRRRTRTPRPTWRRCAPPTGHHAGDRPRPNIFKENNGRGLPKRTFKDKMTIGKRRRPDRLLLLRPRPHQRRRVGGVPGAARHARRRHLLRQEHPAPRRQQRRQRRR